MRRSPELGADGDTRLDHLHAEVRVVVVGNDCHHRTEETRQDGVALELIVDFGKNRPIDDLPDHRIFGDMVAEAAMIERRLDLPGGDAEHVLLGRPEHAQLRHDDADDRVFCHCDLAATFEIIVHSLSPCVPQTIRGRTGTVPWYAYKVKSRPVGRLFLKLWRILPYIYSHVSVLFLYASISECCERRVFPQQPRLEIPSQ